MVYFDEIIYSTCRLRNRACVAMTCFRRSLVGNYCIWGVDGETYIERLLNL